MLISLAIAVVLSQSAPAAPAPEPAPEPAAPAPPTSVPGLAAPAPTDSAAGEPLIPAPLPPKPVAPPGSQLIETSPPAGNKPPPSELNFTPPRHQPSLDEVNRQLERIKRLPSSDMSDALEQLRKSATVPQPGADTQPEHTEAPATPGYWQLSDPEQVMYEARIFFNDVIAGDARGIVLQSGYPFFLEDRRLELPDELHDEWLKNLRSKRTDLLTLYDIEVLTPAEMEKKYGKPPARLAQLPWKRQDLHRGGQPLRPRGRAVAAPVGRGWQVVGVPRLSAPAQRRRCSASPPTPPGGRGPSRGWPREVANERRR